MWISFRDLRINRRELVVALAFLASGFLLRSSSFLQTFLDWDEGLYLLMGDAILDGHPPYTVIWDHKPPGLFLLYALVQSVFGHGVIGIRVVAWLAATLSAYVLYRMGRSISEDGRMLGILGGAFYLVYSLNSQGLAANAEMLFTPLVVLSFWLLLFRWRERPESWVRRAGQFFAVGLLMGLAFEIKYVVIFDLAALLLVLGLQEYRRARRKGVRTFLKRVSSNYAFLSVGFILPFLLATAYFWRSGHFEIYFQSNFIANLAYGRDGFPILAFLKSMSQQVTRNTLLWLAVLLSPIYLYLYQREMRITERRHVLALLIWLLIIFPAVLVTRTFYSHYYLQLMPAMCLLAAWLIVRVLGTVQQWQDTRRYALVMSLVVIGPVLIAALAPLGRGALYASMPYVTGDRYWGDDTAKIAAYLRQNVGPEDYIYAVDYPPIIYYLARARIPTRYPFSLHLLDEEYSGVIGVDQEQELSQIMSKEPTYLIRQYDRDNWYYEAISNHLADDYELDRVVNGVELHVLKDHR